MKWLKETCQSVEVKALRLAGIACVQTSYTDNEEAADKIYNLFRLGHFGHAFELRL